MSEVPETGSVWCENSVVGVKTHFHVNLTCFHIKSPHFHTKVWCELNPCFFLMKCQASQNTFSDSCPLLVHYESTHNIVPSTCTNIVACVYVARPPVTNFATVNLANANAAHPLQKDRMCSLC